MKRIIAIAMLVWFALSASAMALDSETLTVSNTAVGFTAANYVGARSAQLYVETDAIRYTCNPNLTLSSTNGIPAAAGSYIWLDTYVKIKNFRAIRVTTDAKVQAEFFKPGE